MEKASENRKIEKATFLDHIRIWFGLIFVCQQASLICQYGDFVLTLAFTITIGATYV